MEILHDYCWFAYRDKRISHLMVDGNSVSGVSSVGATTLDTDGHLWIGESFCLMLYVSVVKVRNYCFTLPFPRRGGLATFRAQGFTFHGPLRPVLSLSLSLPSLLSHFLPLPLSSSSSPPLPSDVGPPKIQLEGLWGSAVSSLSEVWGGTPAEIEFGAF